MIFPGSIIRVNGMLRVVVSVTNFGHGYSVATRAQDDDSTRGVFAHIAYRLPVTWVHRPTGKLSFERRTFEMVKR